MPCCVYKMSKVRNPQQQIILSGQSYYNFINALRSGSTKQIYDFSLKRYLKFQKCNDLEQLISNDSRLIESQLINYIMYMRQQEKLSYQSVHTYIKALISFYEMNDIVLNKKKIGRYLGEKTRKYKDRAYTIAEIHNILEVCDLRTKVIVL